MKVGLLFDLQFPEQVDPVAASRYLLEEALAAERAGFELLMFSQHYVLSGYRMLQPVPFLAHVAARVGPQVTLGTGILLLALLAPVDAAEQLATLDVLTGGRLVVGVGLGYRQEEYDALGVPATARVRRFVRNLRLLQMLWQGGPVRYADEEVRLEGVRLSVPPAQPGGPPVWMAANSDEAVRRAGRLGLVWLMNPHSRLDTLARQQQLYRQALQQAGLPEPPVRAAIREVVWGPTEEQAWQEARRVLGSKYRTYTGWGQHRVQPADDPWAAEFAELARDRFVVGSSRTCAAELARVARQLSLTHLILRVRWAGSDHGAAMEAIQALGREVLPALKGQGT
ncbi:MAG TPA: LLM class flavin-dependent oxidoreductase [Limnochordales bacterium]